MDGVFEQRQNAGDDAIPLAYVCPRCSLSFVNAKIYVAHTWTAEGFRWGPFKKVEYLHIGCQHKKPIVVRKPTAAEAIDQYDGD